MKIPNYVSQLKIPDYISQRKTPDCNSWLKILNYIWQLKIPNRISWLKIPNHISWLKISNCASWLKIPNSIAQLKIPNIPQLKPLNSVILAGMMEFSLFGVSYVSPSFIPSPPIPVYHLLPNESTQCSHVGILELSLNHSLGFSDRSRHLWVFLRLGIWAVRPLDGAGSLLPILKEPQRERRQGDCAPHRPPRTDPFPPLQNPLLQIHLRDSNWAGIQESIIL